MKQINCLLLAIILLAITQSHYVFSASWFEAKDQSCQSILRTRHISKNYLDQLNAPGERTYLAQSNNKTRLVYRITSKVFGSGKTHYRIASTEVDEQLKNQLKEAIKDVNVNLPVIEGATNLVFALPPTWVALTWTVIYETLKATIPGAKGVPVEGILPLIAVGGEIWRDTVVQRLDNKEIWADATWIYLVQIGSEKRTVILGSCRIPVEIAPLVIETKGDTNNKRLLFEGATARVYDLEDKKFDSLQLTLTEQDPEYLYAVDGDGGQHRFSISGEGWQTVVSSGAWKYFYKKIEFLMP